jgi:peptide deformylase
MVKTAQFLDTNQINLPEPKILDIRIFPDPILKAVCTEVTEVTEDIRELIQNMFITMYNKNGVGLSANQVGKTVRIFVMDTSESGNRRRVFINPEIVSSSGEQKWNEGCLSFPGIFAQVGRFDKIKAKGLDESGALIEVELEGLDAICFQHELDHLNGITFYDHLSQLKRNMMKKKINNLKKLGNNFN